MEKSSRGYDVCTVKRNYAGVRSKKRLPEDTKVFIDTGWDGVQVAPDAVSIEKVAKFR